MLLLESSVQHQDQTFRSKRSTNPELFLLTRVLINDSIPIRILGS